MISGATSAALCICLPGYYSGACLLCDAGYYCAGAVRIKCPPNTFAPPGASNQSDCECMPGFMGSPPGGCVPCLPNTFCSSGKATACGNNSMAAAWATSIDNCSCIPGFYEAGGCVPCPSDRYVEFFFDVARLFTVLGAATAPAVRVSFGASETRPQSDGCKAPTLARAAATMAFFRARVRPVRPTGSRAACLILVHHVSS
jgi:hypothetical protein